MFSIFNHFFDHSDCHSQSPIHNLNHSNRQRTLLNHQSIISAIAIVILNHQLSCKFIPLLNDMAFHSLQCDASQSSLGALMQNGQPVAYALQGLTSTKTRYAQIEKEPMPMCNCSDLVNFETDHKPLDQSSQKPLASAPKHLQRTLLQTSQVQERQRYASGCHTESCLPTGS